MSISFIYNEVNYTVEIFLDKDEFILEFTPPFFSIKIHVLYVDEFIPNKVDENFYIKMTGRHLPTEVISFCEKVLKLKTYL